jgi:hypothetical protein
MLPLFVHRTYVTGYAIRYEDGVLTQKMRKSWFTKISEDAPLKAQPQELQHIFKFLRILRDDACITKY